MATSVEKMSCEEKNTLIQNLAQCIQKHGFENDIKITQYRETVCALGAKEVQDNFQIKIEKTFAPDVKDRVKAF